MSKKGRGAWWNLYQGVKLRKNRKSGIDVGVGGRADVEEEVVGQVEYLLHGTNLTNQLLLGLLGKVGLIFTITLKFIELTKKAELVKLRPGFLRWSGARA